MLFKAKNISYLVFAVVSLWIGFHVYAYFFDTKQPEITLIGLQENGHYCKDMQCAVSGNKSGEFSIWLDGKPLVNSFKIGAHKQHPFSIPTRTISNGQHTVKVELTDKSFRKNHVTQECCFHVDNLPLQSAFVKADADYKVFQGRTLHLQFQVNKPIKKAEVTALAHKYECFPESKNSLVYECFIPIRCEEKPSEYLLSVDMEDNVGNTLTLDNKFQIVLYPFKKQNLHVTAAKLKEEREAADKDSGLAAKLEELAQSSPKQKLWSGAFCTPIDIARVTCEFGTIRTTQEKGRYMHKALDVINMPKSVVWSSQDGVVALKEYYADSGKTVVVDHGWGVLSMYFHLDDFANIEVGQKITKGNPVGTLGKTGYATGYHLHWEMRVNNIQIDPMQWTKTTF